MALFLPYFPRSQPTIWDYHFQTFTFPSNPVHCLRGFEGLEGPVSHVEASVSQDDIQ